jgi:hypothetical protein
VLSVITIRILRLPKASFTLFPFTFFYSAVFHILAHLNMDPVPASWKIMAFFMLSAVGCAAEVTFKRVTGCPVGGWTGRIWATAFMLATGRLAADAWCDAGFMAWDIPSTGFGDAVSRFLWAWVYTPFRRDSM